MKASTLLFLSPAPPCTAVRPRLRYPPLQAALLPPPLELLSPTLPPSISLKGSFVLTVLGPSVDVSVSLTVSDPTPCHQTSPFKSLVGWERGKEAG